MKLADWTDAELHARATDIRRGVWEAQEDPKHPVNSVRHPVHAEAVALIDGLFAELGLIESELRERVKQREQPSVAQEEDDRAQRVNRDRLLSAFR